METGLHVALSSQMAIEKRLSTIANNVANSNTIGFRATTVRFDEALAGASETSPSFVSHGNHHLSSSGGGIDQTGAPLDFAVKGDVWFAVQTPAGVVVTKDGRFQINDAGELTSLDGHPVLDAGESPIQLNPALGTPIASEDGTLLQGGNPAGVIGLFKYQPTADFKRFGNSGIVAETPPEPVVDQNNVGVIQGSLEQSNVNPVEQMSSLITVHRAFDNIAALIRDSESSLDEAIKVLGSRNG